MHKPTSPLSRQNAPALEAEIVRLHKIIQALMNRAERIMKGSDFGLFELAIRLEEEVVRRNEALEMTARDTERINHVLQCTQIQMEVEILVRKRVEEALRLANQHLGKLSTLDPLTGLANRRRFTETLTEEWRRSMRTQESIGLVIIDIDHFKKYNDRYGHPAGDHCLCTVATALGEAVRDTDLAARYGGEEFTFVLPNTDFAEAGRVAERARSAVCALKEPHEGNHYGIVTISAGVSAMVPSSAGSTPEKLIDIADAALYAAKQSGRNKVVGRLGNLNVNLTAGSIETSALTHFPLPIRSVCFDTDSS